MQNRDKILFFFFFFIQRARKKKTFGNRNSKIQNTFSEISILSTLFIYRDFFFCRAYSNACQDDLWNALTEQAQTDRVMDYTLSVKEVMNSWILQPGFPVINVTRNYETDTMIVSQVSFNAFDSTLISNHRTRVIWFRSFCVYINFSATFVSTNARFRAVFCSIILTKPPRTPISPPITSGGYRSRTPRP